MYQTRRHIELVKELIGRKPLIFENTEFVFNSGLVEILKDIGFSALYSEGHDHLHSELNPNYVYSCRNLPLLLRNCRLSDDIAHRFHDSNWDQYPLSPETFARWIAKTPGDCIHIFLDARTFSGSREEAYALSDFFGSLPEALHSNNITTTLPESVISGPSKGELRLEDIGMCSYEGTCALTGIQNMFQQSAFWCLEDGKTLINDKEVWRRLQSTTIFPGWQSNRDRAGDWLQVARARKRMTILMHTCGVLLTARQLRSRTSDPALQRGLSGAFLLKKHSIFSLHFVTSAIQRTVSGSSP